MMGERGQHNLSVQVLLELEIGGLEAQLHKFYQKAASDRDAVSLY